MSQRRKIGDTVMAWNKYKVTILDAPVNHHPVRCGAIKGHCILCKTQLLGCGDPKCTSWFTKEKGYVNECEMSDIK